MRRFQGQIGRFPHPYQADILIQLPVTGAQIASLSKSQASPSPPRTTSLASLSLNQTPRRYGAHKATSKWPCWADVKLRVVIMQDVLRRAQHTRPSSGHNSHLAALTRSIGLCGRKHSLSRGLSIVFRVCTAPWGSNGL